MDEELPGFKVNDYSGSGDEPEADKVVADDVVAEDHMENSSVTHGEGENRPVMLENESMGGAEETALKTAPEQPKVASEESKTVSEGQKSRKKPIIWAVIGVLVLVLIGVGVWLMLGRGEGVSDVLDEPEAGQESGSETERPTEEPEESVIQLALDDELVQGLYKDLEHSTSLWDDGMLFYVEALNGEFSRQQIINMAFYALSTKRYEANLGSAVSTNYCKGTYNLRAGEDEWAATTECFSGEEMRQEIKRLFGFDDYVFREGDVATPACEHRYDVENDEFWAGSFGCGGSIPARVLRGLYKAEQVGDKIYLYETAVFADMTEHVCKMVACGLSETGWDVPLEGVTEEIWQYRDNIRDYPEADKVFDQLKWTFRKDGENYVFESLEKVK